jgi:hypothetical protein
MTKAEEHTQEFIHARLDASQDAVEAALLAIFERQTQEEKLGAYTHVANNVGFSKWDAEFCTSLVMRLKSGKHLTPNQLPHARRKMKRYWRQLITCMTEKLPDPLVEIPQPAQPVRVVGRVPNVQGKVIVPNQPMAHDRALEAYGTW